MTDATTKTQDIEKEMSKLRIRAPASIRSRVKLNESV